jgi:hypothetical protein
MLNDFTSVNLFPVSAGDVLMNLLVALVCGILLAIIYRLTYKGPSYSVSFVNAIVMLTIISALVILVIGNNLARAFGLVGAMSIIRFRTAVRDTMDMVFIFLSLAIGMACGVGLSIVALIGVIVSGLIIIGLTFTNFGQSRRKFHVLQIAYQGAQAPQQFIDRLFSKYCGTVKLVNLKYTGLNQDLEAIYHISLKKERLLDPMVKELSGQSEVNYVNVYFDEDDINPPTI